MTKKYPSGAPKMRRLTSVGLRNDLHAALKLYSRSVGRSLGQVVELAVMDYSAKHPALKSALRETQQESTIK